MGSRAAKPRRLPSRAQAVGRLRVWLLRHGYPRLEMLLIVMLTGGSGLVASFVLVHGGLLHMGWRYLAALATAYAMFMALLWLWLRWRADDCGDPGLDLLPDALPGDHGGSCHPSLELPEAAVGHGGEFGGGGASASFDAAPGEAISDSGPVGELVEGASGVLDADEAAIPLVVILALLAIFAALLAATVWMVWSAPLFFAELLLDGVLMGGLYRRLKRLESQHWVEVALRRTALPYAGVVVLVAGSGFLLQGLYPEAHTLGQVLAQARAG